MDDNKEGLHLFDEENAVVLNNYFSLILTVGNDQNPLQKGVRSNVVMAKKNYFEKMVAMSDFGLAHFCVGHQSKKFFKYFILR